MSQSWVPTSQASTGWLTSEESKTREVLFIYFSTEWSVRLILYTFLWLFQDCYLPWVWRTRTHIYTLIITHILIVGWHVFYVALPGLLNISMHFITVYVWTCTSQLAHKRHLPMQVCPSPPNWYPSSHSQRKVPGWLLQIAWEPQLWGSSLHSSMSDQEKSQLSYANNCRIKSKFEFGALKSNQCPSLSDDQGDQRRELN